MTKRRNWTTWLAVLVLAGALLLVGIGGRSAYMYKAGTAVPLYTNPSAVPSAALSVPSPQWAHAAERARRLVRATLAEQNLPGLSVAVGVGNDIVWAEGFGWADLESRRPVTPATRFRIGTASTALTSAAVGVLLEESRLSLDEEIRRYVPQFPKKQWPVTLRQLMGHVAGVGTDGADQGPLLAQRCERPVEALRHFADPELLFEPGTQYRYSKYGWILVSAAVEAAADQPFLTFMRNQVFQPLGMDDTGAESATEENPEHVGEPAEDAPFLTFIRDVILEPLGMGGTRSRSDIPNLATFYSPRFAADPRHGLHEMRPHNLSCYAGSMAFFSTAADLARFAIAINGGKLLQAATVQQIQTSQRLLSGEETGYGLGWELETVALAGQQTHTVGHDGNMLGGRTASLVTFPEREIVVSVTSNISYANTAWIAGAIAQAFAEQ